MASSSHEMSSDKKAEAISGFQKEKNGGFILNGDANFYLPLLDTAPTNQQDFLTLAAEVEDGILPVGNEYFRVEFAHAIREAAPGILFRNKEVIFFPEHKTINKKNGIVSSLDLMDIIEGLYRNDPKYSVEQLKEDQGLSHLRMALKLLNELSHRDDMCKIVVAQQRHDVLTKLRRDEMLLLSQKKRCPIGRIFHELKAEKSFKEQGTPTKLKKGGEEKKDEESAVYQLPISRKMHCHNLQGM